MPTPSRGHGTLCEPFGGKWITCWPAWRAFFFADRLVPGGGFNRTALVDFLTQILVKVVEQFDGHVDLAVSTLAVRADGDQIFMVTVDCHQFANGLSGTQMLGVMQCRTSIG